MTKTYVVPKVSEQGEEVTVNAKRFDAVLDGMLKTPPETNTGIVAKWRQGKSRTEGKSNSR